MAAGVRGAQDHFWALVKNWKQGINAELRLCSENGRLSMNYFMDLGVWDPPRHPDPPSTDSSRGHQGTRSAGPSRIRRRERRAAARTANATSDTAENVEETAGEPMEKADEANTAVEAQNAKEVTTAGEANNAEEAAFESMSRKSRSCTKCGGSSKGHPGPCGKKCSVVMSTPEKERCTSLQGSRDLSITLTPIKESRGEQCANCEAVMLPNHQCEITLEKIPSKEMEDDQVEKAYEAEGLLCEKCSINFNTNAHLQKHIESGHFLSPRCHYHSSLENALSNENCKEEPDECGLLDELVQPWLGP